MEYFADFSSSTSTAFSWNETLLEAAYQAVHDAGMEVLITFSWTGGSQDVKRIVHAAMRSQNVDYVSPHLYGSGVEPLDAIQ